MLRKKDDPHFRIPDKKGRLCVAHAQAAFRRRHRRHNSSFTLPLDGKFRGNTAIQTGTADILRGIADNQRATRSIQIIRTLLVRAICDIADAASSHEDHHGAFHRRMDDKLFEGADDESDTAHETRGYLGVMREVTSVRWVVRWPVCPRQRERSNPIRCASPFFLVAGGENNSPIGGR